MVKELKAISAVKNEDFSVTCENGAFLMYRGFVPDVPTRRRSRSAESAVPDVPNLRF
jgi:hypothetical protein